ncbi:Type IV pilus biogenesis and competence protein PilQ [bacterium HR19]|nr:Type IV pilus biogenesis and competence protein PilQ [bacterium HR19]
MIRGKKMLSHINTRIFITLLFFIMYLSNHQNLYSDTIQKIFVDVYEIDIKTLFSAISQATGKSFIISPDVDKKVTSRFKGSFDDFMHALEELYDIEFEESKNFIAILPKRKSLKIVRPKFYLKNLVQILPQIEGIKVIKAENFIILEGKEKIIREIEKLVESIDVLPKQIVIEAKIFELSRKAAREIGNILKVSSGDFSGGFEFSDKQGAFVSVNTKLIEYYLNLLEQKGEAKILSAPKILAIEGEKSQIFQGVSIPYETTTQFVVETKFIDALLALEVTPFVSENGIVLETKVSRNFPTSEFRSFRGVPAISRNEIYSKVLVKDGQSAVIGGIIIENQSYTYEGVPVLSRIPIIGFLFRNTKTSKESREIVITLKPEVKEN